MPRLVHLGLGSFHRAHQAWYTHIANCAAEQPWRITGIAMHNPAIRDAMAGDRAYDLGIMGPEGLRVERIAVHDRVLVAAENPSRAVDAIADPDVAAVTVTVTEKGYHLTPNGSLDTEDPDMTSDITAGTTRTAIGLLAHGLSERFKRGGGPVTVLSCDNLSGNGTLLGNALGAFLEATGAAPDTLSGVRFPNTMVDRITPATTGEIAQRIAKAAGRPVTAPVLTEDFSEWVIEEANTPLPDWTRAGAIVTTDVGPYERRKLLLLNAAHSALAYGGLLRGHAYVHEAVADPDLDSHIRALWAEAAPLVPEFSEGDLRTYTEALLNRFSVSGMAHRLSQIATDGSQKLPQRILPILRYHGFRCPAAARVLADWARLLVARVARDEPLDDPMAATLRAAVSGTGTERDRFLRALHCLGLTKSDLPDSLAAQVIGSSARP
jgi:fructuronate reductase